METQQSLGSEARTALLTRLHMDPESPLPANLTSPKPLLGLSPMAAGRVGTGRATAASSSWPGWPSVLLTAHAPAA